ncbi:low molecular weight protein-tyrosine-phosphatase [Isoalcanivorax indicus]|uniref:low molecular weight protein-tyrosine-phosphatase n=1 Tax=Isoalcanivorax indicus TaxID=2202653 RepID=UPI000DBAB586|nr:low molecular weight protein-tyrosine-phosphatase [Isoalcanivorax indicus]
MSVSVLFVCLGNICRSPTAEAVFRGRVQAAGLEDRIRIDSAGTGDWHIGKAPDTRMQRAAARRGYDLAPLRARQVTAADLSAFDYVLAMDNANLNDLRALGDASGHLGLFMDFHPQPPVREVPDPYYGGEAGFDEVLDLVETTSDALLDALRARLG